MAYNSRCARALLIVLALIATACGGTAATTTDTIDETSGAVADAVSTTDAVAVVGDSVDGDDSAAANDADDDAKLGAAVDAPAGIAAPRSMNQVLAFAIEASESESFTFTQGLAINVGAAGTGRPAGAPYAFGEVVDGETHVRVDLETFVAEAMGGLAGFGLGPTDLDGQQFEIWTDGAAVTMDLSKLDLGDEAPQFANGPVSVTLADVDGFDVASIVQQFGQGSQVTDPAYLFEALKSITEAVENGPEMVGDVGVTSYTARVSVGDYYEAIGSGASDQLAIVENLGLADDEADAIAGLLPVMENLELDIDIMVDADGRVRRVSTSMNLTDVVVALFEGSSSLAGEGQPPVDLGALFGPDGLQIVLNGWQEFHDYGAAPAITIPTATDVTDQVNELFAR